MNDNKSFYIILALTGVIGIMAYFLIKKSGNTVYVPINIPNPKQAVLSDNNSYDIDNYNNNNDLPTDLQLLDIKYNTDNPEEESWNLGHNDD